MALKHKPRRGDVVVFGQAPQRWRIAEVRPDGICKIDPVDNPTLKQSSFIWRFTSDGMLNQFATVLA